MENSTSSWLKMIRVMTAPERAMATRFPMEGGRFWVLDCMIRGGRIVSLCMEVVAMVGPGAGGGCGAFVLREEEKEGEGDTISLSIALDELRVRKLF